MKSFTKFGLLGATALLALAMAAPGHAAAITCDDSGSRFVTLDTGDDDPFGGVSVDCDASGTTSGGNTEGKYFEDLGLTQLEKIDAIEDGDGNTTNDPAFGTYFDVSGLGDTNGTISLVDGLVDAILVFKFGSGGISPDWIGFLLSGTTSGFSADWSVDQTQALSHVTLYGERPTDVPEPTTLALMGLGLVAMGYRVRRRQKI